MSDEGEGRREPKVRFIVLHGAEEILEDDAAEVFVAYIQVESREHLRQGQRGPAEEMVLDPLPLLRQRLGDDVPQLRQDEADWTVTVNRVNAEEPIHNPGPHHLLVNGLILKRKKKVHCTVHRVVEGD
jgi:hypothetical protein